MSRRDSHSNRRHSKFDREPSPKRYRRDEKQERERDRGANQRDHRRLHDAVPLEPPSARHSKQEPVVAGNKDTDKKPDEHYEAPKHSSDPAQAPRSRSNFQHDERGSAGQVGRSAGRREAGERGLWKDSKDQHNERVETSHSREQRDEKSQVKLNDNFQRRDGFPERKDDPPPNMRKRPAFREKISVDSGDAKPAATAAVKSSHTDRLPERNERKEERSSNPRHLERPEKQFAEDRAPNQSEARRDGFLSRVRYGGSGGNSNYRGRDKFNGRQGYHPSNTRTDKWKHDLYQEVNKDPIPKSDDDQIAKLEALLAS